MHILIIEDEIKTGKELKKQLELLDESIEIMGILPSVKSALKWFSENKFPDLIFSDIQLADGLSFEIFKQIDVSAPIIFCTAYDEYAIRAFEANSIDYLLKPVEESKLAASLKKYEILKNLFVANHPVQQPEGSFQKKLEDMLGKLSSTSYKSTILVYNQGKIFPLRTADIAYIHYENGIVSIYPFTGQKYVVNHTLDELEAMLNPREFFRANRQFVVGRNCIGTIEHYFTRRLAVNLLVDTPEPVIVSKIKSSEFLRWIEQG